MMEASKSGAANLCPKSSPRIPMSARTLLNRSTSSIGESITEAGEGDTPTSGEFKMMTSSMYRELQKLQRTFAQERNKMEDEKKAREDAYVRDVDELENMLKSLLAEKEAMAKKMETMAVENQRLTVENNMLFRLVKSTKSWTKSSTSASSKSSRSSTAPTPGSPAESHTSGELVDLLWDGTSSPASDQEPEQPLAKWPGAGLRSTIDVWTCAASAAPMKKKIMLDLDVEMDL